MTNLEHYKDEILEYDENVGKVNFCTGFVEPIILRYYNKECRIDVNCAQCELIQAIWLQEEYQEPETDWSAVAVDTPVLVSMDGKCWYHRHFAKYENGIVYSWCNGTTSFTVDSCGCISWPYTKLTEIEE